MADRVIFGTDEDVAGMRITMHKSMLVDHRGEDFQQIAGYFFGIDAQLLYFLLLADLHPINKFHH